MRRNLILMLSLMPVLVLSINAVRQQSVIDLFHQAVHLEEVKGNLQAAIPLYQRVARESNDRSLAAKAQLHIGLCYEKLGQEKVQQAQEAFQKVLDTYPSETDMVKVARGKLTILLKAQSATREGGRKMETRRVLSIKDRYFWHQVSPDGRYIASFDYDEMSVVVLELATGKTRHLRCKVDEHEGKGESLIFRWSPDGKSIVCSWWLGEPAVPTGEWTGLRLLFVDGSAPRRILQGAYFDVEPYSWSSDGRRILGVFYTGKTWTGARMGIISTDDGLVRFLETPVRGDLGNMGFSPDGRYVAYDCRPEADSDSRDIFLLSVDEKTRVPLVTHPAHDAFVGWSPDGTHVLFTSDRLGTEDLWAVAVTDGRPAKEAEVIRRGIGKIELAGITHSGSLYFTTPYRTEDLYTLRIDQETGKGVAPKEKMILPKQGINSAPQYSPDGKLLAYLQASTAGPQTTLCVLSLETREARHFPLGMRAMHPRWSPDGRWVYFTAVLAWRWRMFRIDLETGRYSAVAMQRPDDPNLDEVFIGSSPDGRSIYYLRSEREKGVDRILARNTEKGVEQELFQVQGKLPSTIASISPDGTRLAIMSGDLQRPITIVPTSGNGASKVLYRLETFWGPSPTWPAWTPDGRSIIFTRQSDPTGMGIWRISADGGDPQDLGITTVGDISGICVHPDGNRLAFSAFEPLAKELWVMENFLPPGK